MGFTTMRWDAGRVTDVPPKDRPEPRYRLRPAVYATGFKPVYAPGDETEYAVVPEDQTRQAYGLRQDPMVADKPKPGRSRQGLAPYLKGKVRKAKKAEGRIVSSLMDSLHACCPAVEAAYRGRVVARAKEETEEARFKALPTEHFTVGKTPEASRRLEGHKFDPYFNKPLPGMER